MKANFVTRSGFKCLFLLFIVPGLCIGMARAQTTYEPYAFSRLSGVTGIYGNSDGASSFARLDNPDDVAVDNAGNVYVSDYFEHTIRKITRGVGVTTLAGMAGAAGSADGTGSAARFNTPYGIAVDAAGNVYVADRNNDTIRKVSPAGVVTTLAGMAGVAGTADGTGSAARFNLPAALALDTAGNIYVADTHNYTIRKITPEGIVTTLAGMAGVAGSSDGIGSAARFNLVDGIALDGLGNIYVADTANDTIRKITSAGVVTTLAGMPGVPGSADGVGNSARFHFPWGIASDNAGNIYVADSSNATIRKVTPGGVVTTLAGMAGSYGYTDGTGSAALFGVIDGVALDSAGNIFVVDVTNKAVRQITVAGVVTTFAGGSGVGGVPGTDGTATQSRFNTPYSVAVDSSLNLYIADTYNHVIRKITSAGIVTTLAGSVGNSGSVDGTGSAARFSGPSGVAVDGAGNIYVADLNTSIIRKITPGGVVSTLAGLAGNVGSADGTGPAARFNTPYHLAVDSSGNNIYVADTYNHTIRKITAGGVVSTLAGLAGASGSADGTGSAARFYLPEGVTVDSAGIVYVADTFNHTIRKITSSGVVTTLAGLANTVGSADGTGSAARFYFPYDVAVDRFGSIYAGDANCLIRKITTAGVVTTPAGLAGSVGSADGDGSAARFNYPRGVAVDIWGLVYAADTLNHTIRAIEPFDGRVRTIGGLAGMAGSADGVGGSALYKNPEGVAADRTGNIYVANTNGPTIRKITPGGQVTTFAGIAGVGGQADGPGYAAIFARPVGIAVDRTGNLYVTDYEADTIRKITSSGIVSTLAGSAFVEGSTDGTGSAARFYYPQGIAVDSSGNIFVADTLNHTIRKVTQGGIVSTFAGMAGAAGSTDGTGNAARFNNPTGISVDSSGFIYVADRLNHTVRRITSAGAVSTLAGAAGVTGSADGIGSFARFNNPCGVTVDRAGNIYVADVFNETIRKVTPGGVVTTLGGMPGTFGSSDGVGSAARFYLPFAVASDQAGNLYVADTDNETIRLGLPAVELGGSISHKVHGGAAFDVSMPRIGAPGIECRIGGAPGVHQVIMNFVKPVAIASATVTPDPLAPGAAGSVGSFSVNGGLVTLNLTNISNAQTIIITLGVTDGTYTNNVSIPMGVLAGDVSGNGSANASDISLTKSKSGQAVDATNFRADVTANGVINASDVSAVKTRSGSALP